MPIPLPQPRHTVENVDNRVRVTLPSKKNVIRILWFGLWLFVWGYMVSGFLYILGTIYQAVELGKNSMPEVEPGEVVIAVAIFLVLFLIALLAMGAMVIYAFLWMIVGKEVIDANSKVLKVSRQIFGWQRTREYSASEVKDLRAVVKQSWFRPMRSFQNVLGLNGMIAFDYGTKTFRFGLELDEAEAKQIILALKEGLPQQNAG